MLLFANRGVFFQFFHFPYQQITPLSYSTRATQTHSTGTIQTPCLPTNATRKNAPILPRLSRLTNKYVLWADFIAILTPPRKHRPSNQRASQPIAYQQISFYKGNNATLSLLPTNHHLALYIDVWVASDEVVPRLHAGEV